MSSSPVRLIGGFGTLFLLGFMAALLYPRLSAWWTASPRKPAIVLHGDPQCDPSQRTCTVDFPGMTVGLSLQGPLRTLVPFSVTVQVRNSSSSQPTDVAVSFSMVGMYMGDNRFILSQQDSTTWHGQAMLPVCSSGRSDWRVVVEIGEPPTYQADFFAAIRP